MLGTEIVKHLAGELILTDVTEIDPSQIEVSDAVEKVSFERLDITDFNEVLGMFSRFQPDVILHLAAYTDVGKAEQEKDRCYEINVLGTTNIALAAAQVREKYPEFPDSCFVVYLSTDYVFNGEKGMYKETDSPDPINHYAWTKLRGEEKLLGALPGHSLVIRASFKPRPFEHPQAATDMWTSADYVDVIAPEIALAVLNCWEVRLRTNGIAHIVTERKSMYDLALRSNSDVGQITRAEIPVSLPKDVSLDNRLWTRVKSELGI